ncbi:hypothetical protein H4R34_005051, partial [Dimargaris verticillata]
MAAQSPPYRVGILIVSDSVSAGLATDKTASRLAIALQAVDPTKWHIKSPQVVPDDVPAIQSAICAWADGHPNSGANSRVDLLLTSGGTGLSPHDVTPEAIEPLLDRTCPGFTIAMVTSSLRITPMATLSRPVCGIRKHTLILTLPGSPKGAVENLQAILPSVPHALDLVRGQSSRQLHASLLSSPSTIARTPTPSSCQCHHTSTSRLELASMSSHPPTSVALRDRQSPFPMVTVEDAQACVQRHLLDLGTETVPVTADLIGRVLAVDVVAPCPVPAYRASCVDGYAMCLADDDPDTGHHYPGKTYPVTSNASTAGTLVAELPALPKGHVMRINTGAPVPPEATAVVMVEDTQLYRVNPDTHEEQSITISATTVPTGAHIREIGSDITEGQTVLWAGDRLSGLGAELGTLYSLGIKRVTVYRQPTVGVFSTGSELHDYEPLRENARVESHRASLPVGKIYDANRPLLLASLRQSGFKAVDLGIAPDDLDALRDFVNRSVARSDIEVFVSTGGVSMGEKDLVKPMLEHHLGAKIQFGRVFMKPGKPTVFAVQSHPSTHQPQKLFFALPGNPVSALVAFHLFALPALRRMAHHPQPDPPMVQAK